MVNVSSERGEPPGRSPALERRLRKRRQEARLRMRLAADAALLAEHHASAPPGPGAPGLQAKVESLVVEVAALRQLVVSLQLLVRPASFGATPCDASIGAVCRGGTPGPASELEHGPVPQPGLATAVTGDGMLPNFQIDMVHPRHEAAGKDAKNILLSAVACDEENAPFSLDMRHSSRAIFPTCLASKTPSARRGGGARAEKARGATTTTIFNVYADQGKEDGADATTLRSTPSSAMVLGRETVAAASSTASQGEGDGADDAKAQAAAAKQELAIGQALLRLQAAKAELAETERRAYLWQEIAAGRL